MSTDQGFITNDVDKANHFNKYFQSVCSTPLKGAPSAGSSQCHLPAMPDIDVTYNGVLKLLEELKPHSAPGPDAIPCIVLRNCAATVSKFLVVIFRLSMSTCQLPLQWKSANVVPIHKNGPRCQAPNYRPTHIVDEPVLQNP